MFIFAILLILALVIAVYPLKKHLIFKIVIIPLFVLIVLGAYLKWGSWFKWQDFLDQEKKQSQVQAILKSVKSPQELIEKLKAQLEKNPKSGRGWYLLGRLYSSQGSFIDAQDAYKTAYELNPTNEKIVINYAQSVWQNNGHKFNSLSHQLFQSVLTKNPNQPDALAMLAMESYTKGDYLNAINLWQHLLILLSPDSDDAAAIRKAIAQAQTHLAIN